MYSFCFGNRQLKKSEVRVTCYSFKKKNSGINTKSKKVKFWHESMKT